ncbi:hypothetical protein CEUSTIGMA_g1692.t1 [Chlamydomonas eustigma]|uniref:Uncharacterized protein n=1 Tax=Chlamydomonas eustigma TaxID=1157962 RepID=A0A250WTU9_9CHLO|nr:hypothetical protein CEUSTIGMA_g1692.t1 [Chlamydomonas eustigma]|eukprot:GAX74243.1 hypothetical protein CEUSTIGMA_g1692.t1 [Chlamydomonas eustigma]
MKRAREYHICEATVSEEPGRDLDPSHAAAGNLNNHIVSTPGAKSTALGNSCSTLTSFTAPSAALSIDVSTYQSQLDAKLGKLKALFLDLQIPSIEVFTSEPENYRMRAEFNVRGGRPDERLHYIMFATQPAEGTGDDHCSEDQLEEKSSRDFPSSVEDVKVPTSSLTAAGNAMVEKSNSDMMCAQPADKASETVVNKKKTGRRGQKGSGGPARVEIKTFPVGSQLINELMPAVLEVCSRNPILKLSLFQVNFHTALSGESLVTLLYHKKLGEDWCVAARAMRAELQAAAPSTQGQVPHIIGRSRKQKVCLAQDYVVERLQVHGKQYVYRQYEGSFSQPNAGVCEKMLEWAVDVTRGSEDHDLLVRRREQLQGTQWYGKRHTNGSL